MAETNLSWQYQSIRNTFYILVSLLLLPVDTLALSTIYLIQFLLPYAPLRRYHALRTRKAYPRTVLITGVGMAKGLFLARTFYLAGHTVIGADVEGPGIPFCSGRLSRAIKKFYTLKPVNSESDGKKYIQRLLGIIEREGVDLWISCSSVGSAVEDGQAKEIIEKLTRAKAIQFDAQTTSTLHEKNTFIEYTSSLGLPVPETHGVNSRSAVHKILDRASASKSSKKFIMKYAGTDDTVRGRMVLLPKRTMSATYAHISEMSISKDRPWVLQQFVRGKEYCTHAVVIDNVVRAFVACPSSDLLMHYEALPLNSELRVAMLKYTEEFVRRSFERDVPMTGHLSFDFLVEETTTEQGTSQSILPIECNPRVHTATVLFEGYERQLADIYLSVFKSKGKSDNDNETLDVVKPLSPKKYYWLAHDFVALLIHPFIQLLLFRTSLSAFLSSVVQFVSHVLTWRDGTFAVWDPLPWWALTHVFWPMKFYWALRGQKRWSRVNVSTTKMFMA